MALERAVLLDATMASASDALGGIVLIEAGTYQWSPLEDTCRAQCQTLSVPDVPWGLSARRAGLLAARAAPRRLLRRLLCS
jgi:predicted metal-binding membrane protein